MDNKIIYNVYNRYKIIEFFYYLRLIKHNNIIKLVEPIYESQRKIYNTVVKGVLVHRHQCALRVKGLKLRLSEFVPEFRDE